MFSSVKRRAITAGLSRSCFSSSVEEEPRRVRELRRFWLPSEAKDPPSEAKLPPGLAVANGGTLAEELEPSLAVVRLTGPPAAVVDVVCGGRLTPQPIPSPPRRRVCNKEGEGGPQRESDEARHKSAEPARAWLGLRSATL